ncbi:unnamed protein product [Caenorhabditis nigoni]
MEHQSTCSNRDTLKVGGKEGHFLVALEPILLREDNVRREDVEDLERLRSNAIRKLDYPSFNPTSGNQFYNVVVLKEGAGFRYLEKFRTRVTDNGGDDTKYKKGHLYVDTESIMTPKERLAAVRYSIEELVAWRGGQLVVFGPKSFFTKESTRNIQPDENPMPALLDVAKDWGVGELRRDQEEYTAMDALVLYAIDGGRIVEQLERGLKECKSDSEMTGEYCRTDTFVIEWKRSARTMKTLSRT